jgi:hypothetical protein
MASLSAAANQGTSSLLCGLRSTLYIGVRLWFWVTACQTSWGCGQQRVPKPGLERCCVNQLHGGTQGTQDTSHITQMHLPKPWPNLLLAKTLSGQHQTHTQHRCTRQNPCRQWQAGLGLVAPSTHAHVHMYTCTWTCRTPSIILHIMACNKLLYGPACTQHKTHTQTPSSQPLNRSLPPLSHPLALSPRFPTNQACV